MSRWLPDRWRRCAAGIDDARIAWHQGEVRSAGHQQGLAAIAQATRCRTVMLSAGQDIAVHWLQRPPNDLRSLGELRQVAAARCAHLHGGQPHDWWVAGDWNAREAFVCAALPLSIVASVDASAAKAGVRVQWTTGWIAARRRDRSLAADGWHALRTPRRVMLWNMAAGQVRCIGGWMAGPHDAHDDRDEDELRQQLSRQVALECARDASLATGEVRRGSGMAQRAGSEAEAALVLQEHTA